MAARCLGRLTNWDKTSFRIDSCFTVSQVYQCGRKADGDLCEKCLERPRDGKYQTRILHGLVTEPIPLVSNVYGSPVYWQKMKKFEEAGKVLSLDARAWIEAAEAAQAETETKGWKVQRPSAKEVEKEMKKVKASKAKTAAAAVKPKASQNIKEIFKPVKVRFKEIDKPPIKMETDSIDVCKMVIGELSVFIVDELVFDTDAKGEMGELIGYYRGEEFLEL
jgi:hypothetical protein